ncbi:peroxisome biogenesis factor 13 [Brachionus plicatilis]|uniref:Peroxisomal membrane protein PEX13 n=1 Tax=Brachionus plicatilis TaxID=10195 RepID=A0A3M7S6H7_BRAPC|nr:peroxisome biogenesis factor 13 [Brachionus plicatilis]
MADFNDWRQLANGFADSNTNNTAQASNQSINPLQQAAPPIPPRTNQQISNAIQSNFTPTSYHPPYSSYSGLNSYNYSAPFNTASYGIGGYNSSNSFLRAAEENSRGAFQSIESVVQAFSAVSAMFESTYYAVYNSFRAVVGVADQFYRLKTHLSGILSALAVVRVVKFLYKKCVRMLRMAAHRITNRPIAEDISDLWNESKILTESERFIKENTKRPTNWPLVMFLAVVVGGPWLIWKILSSIESNKDDSLWMSAKIDHFIAVSEFDYDALNNDEISFRKGQKIIIAPKEFQPKLRGWLLGSIDGKTAGIMPANYLKILGKKIGTNSKSN